MASSVTNRLKREVKPDKASKNAERKREGKVSATVKLAAVAAGSLCQFSLALGRFLFPLYPRLLPNFP